jgi:hypothetical protein
MNMAYKEVLVALGLILALCLGLFAGASFFPKTEKVIEVKNVSVEVPVETIVEVEKVIEVEKDYVADAVAKFMKAVEDEEDEAENAVEVLGDYDFESVSIRKISKDYKISIDKDKTAVEFNIKLKFVEGDESEVKEFNVIVTDFVDEDEESTVIVA